jgi:phage shock protein E
MKTALFLFLALFLLAPVTAGAQALFKNLTTDELKQALDQEKKVLVVDTRTSEEYREGHIPTAINIPPQDFGFLQPRLPEDKNAAIVFYCRGYT